MGREVEGFSFRLKECQQYCARNYEKKCKSGQKDTEASITVFLLEMKSVDLNFSRLAGTSLTVTTKHFSSKVKGFKLFINYEIQPPGQFVQYK